MPELSAVVLCYRAGRNSLKAVEPLYEQLRSAGLTFELVLVGNYWPGTDDETPAIVEGFCRQHEHARCVTRPKEGGMGWDLRAGLEAARGDYLIVIDGDTQNPVDDVLRMYREMKAAGFDVMKGRRTNRLDGTYRRVISLGYNVLFRIAFWTSGIWDINGKPKGLRRSAYDQMQLQSNDWFIDAEIVLAARRLRLSIGEIPVVFSASERASFVRVAAIGEFLKNMTHYRLGKFRGS